MSNKISVVTTFHELGYEKYGSRMIKTFLENWPTSVDLWVYCEGLILKETAPNLVKKDLNQAVPELVAFKQKYAQDPRATGRLAMGPVDRKGKQRGLGFRWDAVRFSHKVYAMCNATREIGQGTVLWMDADMVCHSAITENFIHTQMPDHGGVAFLGRAKKYTETGLWAINMNHARSLLFIEQLQWYYDNAEQGVLAMEEFHDCWVFDRTRELMRQKYPDWIQIDWNQGNIQGEGHPLINSAWGAYLDHLKGDRKSMGRSRAQDLLVQRQEGYWQT